MEHPFINDLSGKSLEEIQETIHRMTMIPEDDDPEDEEQYQSIIMEYVNKIFPQKQITEI